ncbi:hypothetical protein [Yersinia aleksiciae]|uniref:hypothetical protein n=1 Tax=Yersinia aleksiciae TaxID=263819 RepID=UPI001427A168|nr:hypothetical protein [Yersinia aleksiciae]MDA5498626.1 hypothetical protein [Yersinia aleksiciae]NIK99327.1 hypothetical protein [Yersinia aleksiciae]WQC71279.1 hypothetical protein N0K21_01980 [Yersinia aleksiciae]
MKKPTCRKNDRLQVRKNNPHAPEARARVIAGLVTSATADFISIVHWLTTGKSNAEAIPLAKCESLRNAISNLETLKAGIQPDWRKALTLMTHEVHSSHKVARVVSPPSKIVSGILSNLSDISQKIASGNATHDMPGRLDNMLQLAVGLDSSDDLAQSIKKVAESAEKALRGYDNPQKKQKTPKPAQPSPTLHDDKAFRDICAPLIGIRDIFDIASFLISMSTRLGCSPVSLAKRAVALKGVIRPEMLPELLELLQQDEYLTALAPPPKIKDDNSRSDGGKLVGLTGIVEGGISIGVEAQRIITIELKKHCPLTAVQRVSFDTARAGLALECDTFKVIEEIRRIAASFNWRPLAAAAYAAHRSPGIRPDIAGDVITLLAQDEVLSTDTKGQS